MKRKKILLLTCVLCGFAFTVIRAQSYYIDFTASGAATTLDSVYVENLTQGTSLTLQGSDTLHLYGTASVTSLYHSNADLRIYPNPFTEKSHLEIYIEVPTVATIDVYDAVGKHMVHLKQSIHKGHNTFDISGFASGHYHLIVKTASGQKSASFISLNTASQNPQIELKSTFAEDFQLKSTEKGTKNIVPMPYTTGDQMQFTGYSGSLIAVVTDVPTSSKTIDVVFAPFTCGDAFIDTRDGNVYATVQIGTQCWMAENLKYLPSVVGSATGSKTTPFYYVYDYDGTDTNAAKATANYTTYGVLYNWPAAMNGAVSSTSNPSGVQGICPTGWHLPSDAEWKQLEMFLGMTQAEANNIGWRGTDEGGKLKETGTTHWNSPNTGATNSSGFTALPGGVRGYSGSFSFIGNTGYWWSSTEDDTYYVWLRFLQNYFSNAFREKYVKEVGHSVRCLRD